MYVKWFLTTLSLSLCMIKDLEATTDLENYLKLSNSSSSSTTLQAQFEERTIVDSFVYAVINYTLKNNEDKYIRYSGEQGRYGEGKVLNSFGILVHVTSEFDKNDHTACSYEISGTNQNTIPFKPWIALVRRGKCTFEEKVQHVWLKGAVGVIVYNDRSSKDLEKMQIKDKQRNISAVFTYKQFGENLAHIVDNEYNVYCSISEGQRLVKPLKTSVLFVSISFIILMCISLVWLIFYYIQRFRYLQSKDQQSRHLCTVTKRVIMKIPTKSGVKYDEKDTDPDCCAICIEVYKPTDCIRILPCNHEFHKHCIDPWLIEHRTCPMCKLDVLKHYGYVVGELTVEHPTSSVTSPTPVQIVHLEIPTDSPLPTRNTYSTGTNPRSRSNSGGHSHSSNLISCNNSSCNVNNNFTRQSNCNCSSSSSNSSNNSITNIIDDDHLHHHRNTTASRQITDV